MYNIRREKILILDFGSQYTQLIARRIRESKVYCEINSFNTPLEVIRDINPRGIILSGGPASVYQKKAPKISREILEMGIPVLGICYGMQLIGYMLGGKVVQSKKGEYGKAYIRILDANDLFHGIDTRADNEHQVWMSHADIIEKLPPGFQPIAYSTDSMIAAFRDEKGLIFGVQFHPEVVHTVIGKQIIDNFLFRICKCSPTWDMKSFEMFIQDEIRRKVGNSKVICAISGGVDSSVTALLVHRAIGENLIGIFVDNGLLRENEREKVENIFNKNLKMNIKIVDHSKRFLNKLKGVTDPEKKRKIIGREFIKVFEEEAKKIKGVEFLAQGTLYPDVIESISVKGPSAVIKSHHNVGGLPKNLRLKLIEPLRELFKDEVRELGRQLGLPEELVTRHPFPGPGLAVRIIGEVTPERLRILRKADLIVEEEIKTAGLFDKLWQAFAILLPVKSVGVMGDRRTYEHVVGIRAVKSIDGMTAEWAKIPYEVLERISSRIINEVCGVNRVVYDISSKPPSTIEWE